MNRIAIQGGLGAFHEIAAQNYFPDGGLEIVPSLTFSDLVNKASDPNLAEGGIMAIENSIAGSLLDNYRLLNTSTLNICGEVYLRIRHNLMALPGTDLSEINEVHSHPVALAQCLDFFENHPRVILVESIDTALSAKNIKENNLNGIAAIASSAAANLYDLEILSSGIEDNKQNFTRFLILNRNKNKDTRSNKASVSFCLPHSPGSLAKILTQLAQSGANLTKIQSVPLVGKEWQYIFFIDFVQEPAQLMNSLKQLEEITIDLNILGTYQSGNYYES